MNKNLYTKDELRKIFYTFFGMDKDWKWGRNVMGMLMVHAPEYPTYLIPAYTQAKATGDAKELKKGEGARGLLTGMLEGVAIGALVSGRKFEMKKMVPYIILGAALQFFSSKFFPWIAEKAGRRAYRRKNNATNVLNIESPCDVNPLEIGNLHPPQDPNKPKPFAQAFKSNQYSVYPNVFASNKFKI